MVAQLGFPSLEALIDAAIPPQIRTQRPLDLKPASSEFEALSELRALAEQNDVFRSYIGLGYANCVTPPVIQRNILESPGWYTQYTPYQAEIAQGRLEALLNYQTMIMDLTGLPIANASLLDEATAAAEAMFMCYSINGRKKDAPKTFFVSEQCPPQTIAVVETRAKALGIELIVADHLTFDFERPVFGALLQYPDVDGTIHDYEAFVARAHDAGALVCVAADILSLALLKPPGEFGADIAVGNTQRFGVPLGYGGPHAAYLATREEFKRQVPGRIVGVSKDVDGHPAVRLALQTREQHIRRDKATSNICTAQVLLAIIASMYAVYHGPDGIRRIAERVHLMTGVLAKGLQSLGYKITTTAFFDTLRIEADEARVTAIHQLAANHRINLRVIDAAAFGITLDETVSEGDLQELLSLFAEAAGAPQPETPAQLATTVQSALPEKLRRESSYLTHPVFNQYHSETEMLRYLHRLQSRDLSLTTSMIPLGSCTMKLNATAEMFPVTWREFGGIHPFVPVEQTTGYLEMMTQLEDMLAEITGFSAVSLQPNAGSQGEYAGLLVIKKYHEANGDHDRNVCLIPSSAHGTNPASAVLAGMRVVVVNCDPNGNINVEDLQKKAEKYKETLAALMVTYPSTHGVFEESIVDICTILHEHGGQVYMDGANMNAQVGLVRPGEFGADVCHLNLHKTFCIPHGGGGPGMGPIGVAKHLAPFLPGHPLVKTGGEQAMGAISAAPWGSPSILPISWMYIRMMGAEGLTEATRTAILNANYIARRLENDYKVLYTGKHGLVAHECIFDCRPFADTAGIEVEDIAKRLMDYGFHAPTISFPVAGTMMVEPTESESLAELDRFCEAMLTIRAEIADIENGISDRNDNLLKHAPHTAEQVTRDEWTRPYSRQSAAFPTLWSLQNKFWPVVGRIDQVYGDRNLICSCLPLEDYT